MICSWDDVTMDANCLIFASLVYKVAPFAQREDLRWRRDLFLPLKEERLDWKETRVLLLKELRLRVYSEPMNDE